MNNLYRFLRCAVIMAAMVFVGGSTAWGQTAQTGLSGVYYIANYYQYNAASPDSTISWYLVPAKDPQVANTCADAYYSPNCTTCNEDKPFITTYQTNRHDNDTSVWVLKEVDGEPGFYYMIHAKTGKYLVYEPPFSGGNGGDGRRKSFHLQTQADLILNDSAKFEITDVPNPNNSVGDWNGDQRLIRIKKLTTGNRFLNPAGDQANYYHAILEGQSPHWYLGLVGVYEFYDGGNQNGNRNTRWYLESTLMTQPTISDVTADHTITITDANGLPEGYTIRYTTGDGSQAAPTATTGTEYTGPITVTDNWTVKAVVVHYGIVLTSVAEKAVSPVAAPTITNNFDGTISLSTATPDATIYYTTDGTTPDNNSPEYSSPISLEEISLEEDVMVIKAIAYLDSEYSTVSIYNVPTYTKPTISYNNSTSKITITCTGATGIYYTTDGSTPTTSDTLFREPFTVSSGTTVKAIATHPGYLNSDVATKYIQDNDYSQNYLTFNVLTDGTIPWKSNGSGMAKEIFYRINGGSSWTSITAGSNTAISVVAGDVVEFKGTNQKYAKDKSNYSGFEGGTATFDIEGNIMSLIYGDDFDSNSAFPSGSEYNFCSIFKLSNAVSAENLILPATTLTNYCYRAMFSKAPNLAVAPALPATTLAKGCYWYMFEECPITTAPDLEATTLVAECYGHMFENCSNLNYIKCLAVNNITSSYLTDWVKSVSSTGTFVKDVDADWSYGASGIPSGWIVESAELVAPVITCDGEFITITCQTYGASINYRLGQTGEFSLYSASIAIHENTVVEAYAEKNEVRSDTVSENCVATKSYQFAGMEITPGPLCYGSNGYEIKDGWNYDSYNSAYGKTVGSTYFNFIELGQLFESSVFSTTDGDVEKVLYPLDEWRLPTSAEWDSILGTTRSGSTVNGSPNKHYAMIQLTSVTHANSSTPSGLLIFPDGETITDVVALSNMDNTTSNTGITESELNAYLDQGCIFLPGSGYYNGNNQTWDNEHYYYWSSTETENDSLTGYDLYFAPSNTISSVDYKNKGTYYFPVYLVKDAADKATRLLRTWTYNNNEVELPYSANAIDGHSLTSSYATDLFNFTTDVKVKESQPTYLWFQHADQSADIYVNNTMVETHWGGYNAFFTDITDYVATPGIYNIRVTLNNTTRNTLAPYAGDFNFNATLGEVKLISSPVVPDPKYGYDGFHITSTVNSSSATITVKTTVPTDATVICSIKGTNCNYSDTLTSDGTEMTFDTTFSNPHLWHGTADPYLYDVTLTIVKDGVVYHKFKRGYGLRFFEYVIDAPNIVENGNYTGFLLNGQPYLLRGVCVHDDLEGKANALNDADYTQEFNIITELGCNFLRLAHYPHPKEVYDRCDKLGIIVQTEVPWVNNANSTLPSDYYTHLEGQYADMVSQHYNHPCILFWGLSNETTTDDKAFAKTKIEQYTTQIKALDSERMVGYVMSHSYNDPYGYYNSPDGIDWLGCNIYVGWYIDQSLNNPTNQLNTRIKNTITNKGKALAFSEYGGGGTQHCHSESASTTTNKASRGARHDIEYQMWLHEGHIAAIKNKPELLFTSVWQLFDIAVSSRNEGYTVCPDGINTYIDDNLRKLNDKGLVERDHVTKKDTYYLYKAWWNPSDKFVHICGKDYEKLTDRVIKCYTNDGNSLSLYVNNTFIESVDVTDNIATFTAWNFSSGDVIRVNGATTNDTFTITDHSNSTAVFTTDGPWNKASNWSDNAVPTAVSNVRIEADATIPAKYVAHVGGITINGGSLTIADSAQLYHNNTGVRATVEKNITGHANNLGGGWNFIASPVTTCDITDTDLTSGSFDLYRFNQDAALEWENYKTHSSTDFTTLAHGKGYLYANEATTTVSFTGTLADPTSGEVAVSYSTGNQNVNMRGWNLVGNPFACNAYLSGGFYGIDGPGLPVTARTSNTPIVPCEGVMVQATEGQTSITFSKTPPRTTTNQGNLQITLSQPMANMRGNGVMDKAIVSFNESERLEKFIFNPDNAKLYIPQGGKDYAIAFSEGQGEIPVNFEATEDGTYTITVSPEGVEMNYLHLIDNMTGADVDLVDTPTYTFTAKTTDYASRFRLVFAPIGEDTDGDEDASFAFVSDGNIIVNGEGTLQVVDVMGRIIVSRDAACHVSTEGMTPGVYVLRLINGDDVKTQKIVVR